MKHDWAKESAQICTGMIQKLGKYASEEWAGEISIGGNLEDSDKREAGRDLKQVQDQEESHGEENKDHAYLIFVTDAQTMSM